MAWVIAIGGIILLIILHEAGHFLAAKAVGMRVERFSLFFPPTLFKLKWGETEYAIGAIPAGGYVKITGMSPEEMAELDPQLRQRAYYAQPPWKRIVVILAGPGTNLLIAFAIFAAVLMAGTLGGANTIANIAPQVTTLTNGTDVDEIGQGYPAYGHLHLGDRIVAIDGKPASYDSVLRTIRSDTCPGAVTAGCRAAKPVALVVQRGGTRRTITIYPRYESQVKRMEVGVALLAPRHFGLLGALGASAATMWSITASTVSGLVHALTSAKARGHLSGIIGITQVTEQAVALGPVYGLLIIGFVSLVLGVINLFPFLPLDGGHVLWSVAEKLRGSRISTGAMWKFSSVGIVLLAFLVVSGLSNNINRLAGG
ncbi:MAG: site-2 protease family protein [Solirubrobacteraceae bacterium]